MVMTPLCSVSILSMAVNYQNCKQTWQEGSNKNIEFYRSNHMLWIELNSLHMLFAYNFHFSIKFHFMFTSTKKIGKTSYFIVLVFYEIKHIRIFTYFDSVAFVKLFYWAMYDFGRYMPCSPDEFREIKVLWVENQEMSR